MGSSHDIPDSFDYDVLADVSQHGSSVFDFLSHANMFGPPGLSSHHMHSPNFSSPLQHARPTVDHPMTSLSLMHSVPHGVPDGPLQMHNETLSPHGPTISTAPIDTSMSPPSESAKNNKNLPLGPSAQSVTQEKPEPKPDNQPRKVTRVNQQRPFGGGALLPNQAESFCTTETGPKRHHSVALPIAKLERRGRSTRSDPTVTSRRDENGSYSGSVDGNAMTSPSTLDGLEPGKDVHNSHTRRCRAKVNNKFQELLQILPKPPPKTGVKHKAQILDYTIRVFREIYAKKLHLEAELALSSKEQLHKWVDSVVRPASQLADILNPFMSLICTKEKWQFAETWVPVLPSSATWECNNGSTNGQASNPGAQIQHGQSMKNSQKPANGQSDVSRSVPDGAVSGESRSLVPLPPRPQAPLRLGTSIIPSTDNFDDPDLQSKLERFRDRSRSFVCKPRVDPPGRIMCTMRPEWLPSLEDEEAFQRAALAKEASLSVCFGIPFFVRGHVAAVVVFFDVDERRRYDAKCVDLAGSIAGLLGNAFGARSVDESK